MSGWPISHTNAASAAFTTLKATPGANQSHYVTGLCLTGGASADGITLLRRAALTFTAANNTLTVSDNAALEFATGDGAIEFGAAFASTAVAIETVITKDDASDDGFIVGTNATGQLYCTVGDGTDTATATTYTFVCDGVWRHYIINIEAGETDGLQIYVNGKADGAAANIEDVDSIDAGSTDLVCTGEASKTFYLSSLGLYKGQILSASEIATRYANGAGSKFAGTETGLSAAWNLDEGTGTAHADLVASNDGTSANTSWTDGVGLPIDRDTLTQVGKFTTGIISTNGGINGVTMTFPEALKIGRNNPLRINETDGAFNCILFGYTSDY